MLRYAMLGIKNFNKLTSRFDGATLALLNVLYQSRLCPFA